MIRIKESAIIPQLVYQMTSVKRFYLLLCLLVLVACNASTQLSGIVDPFYRDGFQSQKMIVMGSGMSIAELKALELTLAESFTKYDVHILYGLDVFPPTREYSEEDIYKIAIQEGADTILIISANGRDVSESYVPLIYNGIFFTGGYSVTNLSMSVSAHLKNPNNREVIWKAEGISGGGDSSSFSDLAISLAKATVIELSKEGLIVKKKDN